MKKSFDILPLGESVVRATGTDHPMSSNLFNNNIQSAVGEETAVESKGPVHVFLKEMGQVPLLNQEGEVRLAQEIEQGEAALRSVLFTLPVTLNYLWTVHEQLRREEIPLRDIIAAESSGEAEQGKVLDDSQAQEGL